MSIDKNKSVSEIQQTWYVSVYEICILKPR